MNFGNKYGSFLKILYTLVGEQSGVFPGFSYSFPRFYEYFTRISPIDLQGNPCKIRVKPRKNIGKTQENARLFADQGVHFLRNLVFGSNITKLRTQMPKMIKKQNTYLQTNRVTCAYMSRVVNSIVVKQCAHHNSVP